MIRRPAARPSRFAAFALLALLCGACESKSQKQTAPPASPTGNAVDRFRRSRAAGRAATSSEVADDPRARQIVDEMLRIYAACRTYTDRGMVRVDVNIGRFGRAIDQPFYTTFVRPDRFRFEHRVKKRGGQDLDVNVVWVRGDEFRSHGGLLWSLMSYNFFDEDDLDAPEGPTWVSTAVSAALINDSVAMIMPDHTGGRGIGVAALRGLRHVGEEDVEGRRCYKIQGDIDVQDLDRMPEIPFWNVSDEVKVEATATLWIEKRRHLLLRMQQIVTARDLGTIDTLGGMRRMPDVRTEITKLFYPRLDEPVPWYRLALDVHGELEDVSGDLDFEPTTLDKEGAEAAARRIVSDAISAYAACKTYRDRGTFVVASARRSNRTEQRIKFHTAFARPGRFRYRLSHDPDDGPPQDCIIWSDGQAVRLWQPGAGESQPPSISAAVSTVDMASRLPTATISGLLMPEMVGGSFLTTASALVLQGEQDLGKTPCHRVRGRDPYGLNFTAWFEKKRKVLRKLRIKFHGYEAPVWIEADFAVRLDSKVTDKQLAYDPPTDEAG